MPVDRETFAGEIDGIGRRQISAVHSHRAHVIGHLLTLEFSPAAGPRPGWTRSVHSHRFDVAGVLDDSPSIRARPAESLPKLGSNGRCLAAAGLAADGFAERDLPAACPGTLDQILDPDWRRSSRTARRPAFLRA